MALLVLTAALYMSHNAAWKESSRAPSLASSSAHSLPAACIIPLGLLRFGQVRLALRHRVDVSLFTDVSETFPYSLPHIGVRSSSRRAPLLVPLLAPSTAAKSEMEDAPSSARSNACSKAQISALMMRRCTKQTSSYVRSVTCATAHPNYPPCAPCLHINDPSTKKLPPKVARHTVVHPAMNSAIVCASRKLLLHRCIRPLSHFIVSSVTP